jgi:predicted lipase
MILKYTNTSTFHSGSICFFVNHAFNPTDKIVNVVIVCVMLFDSWMSVIVSEHYHIKS